MPPVYVPRYPPPQAQELRDRKDAIFAGALAGARAAQKAVAPTPMVPPAPDQGGAQGMPGDVMASLMGAPGAGAPQMPATPPMPQMPPPQSMPQPSPAPAMPAMPQLGPPPALGPNGDSGLPPPDATMQPAPAPLPPHMAAGGLAPGGGSVGASTQPPPGVIPAHVFAEIAMRAMRGDNPEHVIQDIASRGPGGAPTPESGPQVAAPPPSPPDNLPAPPPEFTRWLSVATPDATNEFGQALLAAYQAQPDAVAQMWAAVQAQAKADPKALPPELRAVAGAKGSTAAKDRGTPPPVPSVPMQKAARRN